MPLVVLRKVAFLAKQERVTADPADPFTWREATDKIMRVFGQMSGLEKVDICSSRAKEILREDETD